MRKFISVLIMILLFSVSMIFFIIDINLKNEVCSKILDGFWIAIDSVNTWGYKCLT